MNVRHRCGVAVVALSPAWLLVSCAGSEPAADLPATPSVSPSTAETTEAAGLGPNCVDREPPAWVSEASHEADGVADPAGRIYFGQIIRETDVVGQVVRPLFAVDPDGSDLQQVLNCEIHRPRVSPDGTRLAFSIMLSNDTWQVATSAVDGSDLQVLTSGQGYSETPDWSPDGSWLVYSRTEKACQSQDWESCEGVFWRLWRMDADGGNQQQIGDDGDFDWEPRVSPDGRTVVFTRMTFEPETDLWLVVRDLATGEERTLEHPTLTLEHPDWSPDGTWIIYNTFGDPGCTSCESIERVPADDLQAEPDVLYPADEDHGGYKPAYAPDGSQITFGCEGRLCVMGPDGENPTVLIEEPDVQLNHFDWGPTV